MLKEWKGEFGDSYTLRNNPDVVALARVFERMLYRAALEKKVRSGHALEVGCGRGSNLLALQHFGFPNVTGVEPNLKARTLAREAGLDVYDDEAINLRFGDSTVMLVFTCGVLIHIPPDEIEQAMKEIVRVSSKWVLCVEYYAPEERETEYRGLRNILWKRDYRRLYENLGLTVKDGDTADPDLFPGCEWWLLRKPTPKS